MLEQVVVALFGLGRADISIAEDEIESYHLKDSVDVLHVSRNHVVFQDSEVRAIIICTPTREHENLVKEGLENGKAIFCEKPISNSVEKAIGLYEKAEELNLPLFCAFNRRFDPSLMSLKEKLKLGKIGDIYSIKTCSRDNPVPLSEYLRTSGGIFHDCAVHDIDIVCWLANELPNSLVVMATANNSKIKEMGDVDVAFITMKFPSGLIGCIEVGRCANYGYDQRVEVHGNKGMLVSGNQHDNELTLFSKDGSKTQPLKYSFPQRYRESYILELEHFINIVLGLDKCSITKSDTINTSLIADACHKSMETGQLIHLNLTGFNNNNSNNNRNNTTINNTNDKNGKIDK